jgi:hypothetical protein
VRLGCALADSQADSRSVPPRNRPSATPAQRDEQLDVLARLADEIRVVRDVLDEVREELSFAVRNPRSHQCSVVHQFGLDPTADNWGEKLMIARPKSTGVHKETDSREVDDARTLIRELLTICERTVDELNGDTQSILTRARQYASSVDNGTVDVPPAPPAETHSQPVQKNTRSSGQLF